MKFKIDSKERYKKRFDYFDYLLFSIIFHYFNIQLI
jgi:hypothetical protein